MHEANNKGNTEQKIQGEDEGTAVVSLSLEELESNRGVLTLKANAGMLA